MESPPPITKFKVIIVGGSIAGLTLAHCLSKLNVAYVVLEKRHEISPQEGASIGILPNGGQILDQLGLFDEIERNVEPLTTAHISYPDGFRHTNHSPKVILERFGLPLAFLERRKLLQILHRSLPDTSRIIVDKNVTAIRPGKNNNCVAVHTKDGSVYQGDLVVGADGVHSQVRREMWRLADEEKPGHITIQEKNGMNVDYACVFGISDAVPELCPGEQIASLNDGRSFLTFPGKDGRAFWFLLKKLDRQYLYSAAPRWSDSGIETIAEAFARDHIWNGIEFGDLWKRRQVVGITNLEENVFSTWHWGRIVCIGDSMHKMAPNTGQGANCAIEDAAALANAIVSISRSSEENLSTEIESALDFFHRSRLVRVREIYDSARMVIRLHARETFNLKFLGRYYLPYTGDLPADTASRMIAAGVHLSFLAPSRRSGPGWEQYRRKDGASNFVIIGTMALAVVLWFTLFKDGASSLS
ncbi:hypothetical protein BDV06DRAFT_232152 [Aspergillus oleicola]